MILQALCALYERLDKKKKVLPKGFTKEKISFAIVLTKDGKAVAVKDIREMSGKQTRPKLLDVPESCKRPGNIKPFFCWDNTAYVLGVAGEAKRARASEMHTAFKNQMLDATDGTKDEGLIALREFLQNWSPDMFQEPQFDANEDIIDTNIVFKLDGEQQYLHNRPAAKELWHQLSSKKDYGNMGTCLITGEEAPIARIHPAIKGVREAQSSGASIVSFNKASFTSFGKEQSYNAPISEQATDKYTKALNYLLRERSLSIGDTTTVFWAVADDANQAEQAESFLGSILDPHVSNEQEEGSIGEALNAIAKGRSLQEIKPDIQDTTQFFVLGISPNAARLSIRFWQAGTLDLFVKRIAKHYQDLRLEPLSWKTPPSIWRLLGETAPSRNGKHESKDISPHLAGELMRSILTGANYPYSLLTSVVMRMRTDGDISPLRVSICKAVLSRFYRKLKKKEKIPVALDKEEKNSGYLLGRLFAEFESAQQAAIKDSGTTVASQYYGSASATPSATFPTLFRKYQHHKSKLSKEDGSKGIAVNTDKRIGEIVSQLATEFPKTLDINDQGRFAIGYYQQRQERFKKSDKSESTTDNNTTSKE
ncbi:MAG: type I-C CRISPR-associated protein Cas8c/Csd1 [Pseudomonadota bacterium]|nr:type I-C CRISPR-associated protein Cas8c/Csd1 [Pseudomonadota bacterium]